MENNMKIGLFVLCLILISSCSKTKITEPEKVLTENIRFCESIYPLNGKLLIANFGSSVLDPLNNEGKGYILSYENDKMEMFIPTDGNLSAPRGMYSKNNKLYICDVNKVVVYNLEDKKEAPTVIQFPADDLLVNDIVGKDDFIYISVTNTGRIYKVDISSLDSEPELWCEVAGANGLLINGTKMFIASYPPDELIKDENAIYEIADLSNPKPSKLIEVGGMYDGVAISENNKLLYVTSWETASIYTIDLAKNERKLSLVKIDTKIVGPADICIYNNHLYIPDLASSKVVIKRLD